MEGHKCNVCQSGEWCNDGLQCDICDKWMHLRCVNQDESIYTSDKKWSCPRCLAIAASDTPCCYEMEISAPVRREEEGASSSAKASVSPSRFPPSRIAGNGFAASPEVSPLANHSPLSSPSRSQPIETRNNVSYPTLDEISKCMRNMLEERSGSVGQPWDQRRLETAIEAVLQRRETEGRASLQTGNVRGNSTAYGYWDNNHELTRSQAFSRQSVTAKLPTFSGNPEEWAMFEAAYEETTRLFGFSDGENIVRLQQALKGKALRAVQCRLRRAEHLESALTTLRKMYGRPELIVNSLMDQIRRQTPPKADKLDSLVDFAVSVEEVCATVQSSGVQNRFDGPILQELVSQLPPMLQLQWGLQCVKGPLPVATLKAFGEWMETVKDAILLVTSTIANTGERRGHGRFVNIHSTDQDSGNTQLRCGCNNNCANILDCEGYWKMSVAERWNIVREHVRCKSCLRRHQGRCRQPRVCGKEGCTASHHPSLHRLTPPEQPHRQGEQRNREVGINESNLSHSTAAGSSVLLRYLPVILHSGERRVETLALLDEGSTVTLMEHSLLKELGAKGIAQPLCLNWTGGQQRNESNSVKVNLMVSGVNGKNNLYELKAVRTVRCLGLPAQRVDAIELSSRYEHLNALPVSSFGRTVPRIIIGMDNYHLTRPLKTIEGSPDEPIATKTRLGWTISGRCDSSVLPVDGFTVSFHQFRLCECNDLEARVDAALKGSFELEEASSAIKTIRSKADERAIRLLETTTTYENGRYVTGLLWKADDIILPDNYAAAVKRMQCLERKMGKDVNLWSVMNDKLYAYLEKGYIRPITKEEKLIAYPRKWYLPIFPVFNPNKPGKVRIVWDAAAATRGVSLNSALLTGPDLLVPLPNVLRRFRENKIAIAADVSEMYHRVSIRAEDQHSQRFLWRWDPQQDEASEFVMQRMTFGATCSPSCAQFIKNANADRFSSVYPLASKFIREDHYVDDLLTSVESIDVAVQVAQQVKEIQMEGGFPLHHWLSNSTDVLSAIGENTVQHKALNLDATVATQKVLGMWWDPASDAFCFKIPQANQTLRNRSTPTKRQVLSALMAMYDPLGLIAGLLFYVKVMLQEIWRAGTAWDEEIPQFINEKWQRWVTCLPELEKISIPRCYRRYTEINETEVQLHVFVDAGKDGFSAVAYFRFKQDQLLETALVGGKTRVAPLKYLSIPRLELQAAVLGVRLAKAIRQAHRMEIHSQHFWTDSKDVICWLRSDHRRYSTFVAHRIGEILEGSQIPEWHWVPTQFNVADEGTKFTNLENHLKTSKWFTGPEFLQSPRTNWPEENSQYFETTEEIRHSVNLHSAREPFVQYDRFGKWDKLRRTVSYVWRFVHNLRSAKEERLTGPLTSNELQRAENTIFKEVQQQAFTDEYRQLKRQKVHPSYRVRLARSSPLVKCSPYLDEEGVLRVNGRIDACRYVGDDTKRPIILPKTGTVTELIVGDYHRRYHHANHQTVMNEIRQRFDIPALRAVCHRVRATCQICHIRKARPCPPMMGNLPEARLAPFNRPFSFTGVDYFGPFLVINGRRTEKRWGVLFTCLTVRAIHIEVAHSLNTSSCIIALRNFIARRGTPNEIISDRGTNFIGAEKELRENLEKVDRNVIIQEMNLPNTRWTFNPPAAPHFGGAWERLVQAVKRGLYHVQFTRTPTDQVFNNWLIEVEAVINTRPLTDVPVDREEDAPITPNHFLIGSSSGVKPLSICDDSGDALRNTWKTSQMYVNIFWRKWLATYLPNLTKRSKWFKPQDPLRVGDIVIIVDENLPRSCWPKGRIVLAEPSKDGEVRRAHVQTASGRIMERPAVKLARIVIAPKQ